MNRVRLRVDGVEERLTPAPLTVSWLSGLRAQATVRPTVAEYCQAMSGKRVGGGECAHLAVEALRAAGFRFAWPGLSPNGDYAWGALVATASPSSPLIGLRPGDVLQYRNAVGAFGSTAQHTAIVATVDSIGRPLSVYEQNWNGERVVRRHAVDLSLTSGRVAAYRPIPFTIISAVWKWTVTNETDRPVTVTEQGSGWVARYTLGPAGSPDSFTIRHAWGSRPWLWANGTAVQPRNAVAVVVEAGGPRIV